MAGLKPYWVTFLAVASALLVTMAAHAHPGHGTTPPDSPAHLLEPVHFVPLLAGLCAIGVLSGLLVHHRRLAKARAAQSTGQPPAQRDV